ncbi:hypothetical protein CAEBREN_01557 [Caenorhabditis brenneri]|uniref:Uncharacterized protein n=1 Tax=Caenorhabditis brenneri TaxID=135651 RepID=G0MU77_CAEBE|nr:hypothetical protein CAEBREN_01557 [Caenorhabditis brenneri]
MLFDYSVGLLTVPIILLPTFSGVSNGVLSKFGVPNVYQAILVLTFLAYVQNSILAIFENRFHTLCTYFGKKLWVYLRIPWLLSHYFVIVFFLCLFGYIAPEQSSAVSKVLEILPCIGSTLQSNLIYVMAQDHTYHLILIVVFIAGSGFESLFFVGAIVFSTIKQLKRQKVSKKTFEMQRTFFIAIVIQIMVPLIMLIIPFIYAWIAVAFEYHNQSFTNFAVIIASMHGFVSTLVMLFVHHPYRKEILFWFSRSSRDFENNQWQSIRRVS